MRRSVLGSIAAHGALAALLYGLARRPPLPPPPRPIEIEVVPPASEPERTVPAARSSASSAASAFAPATPPSPASPSPAPPTPSAPPSRSAPPSPSAPQYSAHAPRSIVASTAPDRPTITGYDRGGSAPSTIDGSRTSDGVGFGQGSGAGFGSGQGSGAGLGLDDGLGALPSLPPPPAPPLPVEPPPSKARPPKLIYPARDRESDEAETFVARLTIDTDGYVVGARLVHGLGSSRDELASQLVWRFRYAPALDDEGRAIRSTIDQRFLVGF